MLAVALGSLGVQYAKAMGYRVLAIDAGKKDYCLSVGAEAYLDANEATVDAVEKTGVVQAAIVTGDVGNAYQVAMDFLGPFGTLVCVGIPPSDQRVSFHPMELVNKGIRIIGSAVGTRQDILEAAECRPSWGCQAFNQYRKSR